MYTETTYDLGKVREVMKYHSGNYGAPGNRRKLKKKPTPEDVKRQNRTNRVRSMQRMLLANFQGGDWHLTPTYRENERPGDLKEAKDKIKEFCGNMRDAYKKAGYEFKYICVTEKGKRGAFHHHLIIEDIADENLNTKKLVAKFWTYGSKRYTEMYEEGEFKELAEYLVKEEGKDGQKCAYTRSRNLIVPEPRRERVWGRWEEEPEPEEGWYIIKGSLLNDINRVTGHPYQRYMMRRLDGKEASGDGGSENIHSDFMEGTRKDGWRGKVAGRAHKERRAKDSGGIRSPGRRNSDTGKPYGINQRASSAEQAKKAVPRKDIHGMREHIKNCTERLVSAVAGKRMGKRKRDAGKERRSLEDVP